MKKFNTSILAAIFIISGNVTLTSCTGTVEDIADGLVNGMTDQIVGGDGQNKQEEQQALDRLNYLLNWKVGKEVDQEAINKFGFDNCFQVTEVPTNIWDKAGTNSISPNVDRNELCLVRCLYYTYAVNGYAPHVGGLICNKRIGNELVEIFRELYEAKYVIVHTDALQEKSKLGLQECTYAYYYNQEEAETIPMAQQQGMAVVVNGDKPLVTNDIAVRLFKDKGFTWGGDEPNGNPNYFSK